MAERNTTGNLMFRLSPSTQRKIRRVLLFLFTVHFSIMFIHHEYLKFDPNGFWGPAFQRWGYPVWFVFFIGVVELVGGIGILIPRVATYAALLLATNMLGAFVTRLINGMSFDEGPSILFCMVSMLFLAYEFNPLKRCLEADSPQPASQDSSSFPFERHVE